MRNREAVVRVAREDRGTRTSVEQEQLEQQQAAVQRRTEKPPRTKSLRGKSGKKSGGQVGHKGGTLKQVANPDRIEPHEADCCRHCRAGLTPAMVTGVAKRQVFDLPEPRLEVTEHRASIYCCAACGGGTRADFPEGVSSPA